MKTSTKKLAIFISLTFGIFSHAFAYCNSIDSAILSNSFQTLKSIEMKMDKYHKEDMDKRIDTLAILHNDMVQINTYLMNMTVLLNTMIDNQREGLQVKNKPVAMLKDNDKKEDKKNIKKQEEVMVK